MTLQHRIVQKISSNVGESNRFVVALSGGLDSMVLAHIVAHSPLVDRASAVHVHHGLSKNADSWLDHCHSCCVSWGLSFTAEKVDVCLSSGGGVEDAARQARLRVFESLLNENDVVLTAHHKNDQLETFFYRLMRGAGLQGLCAMRDARRLGRGVIYRPLLDITRAELQDYAESAALTWVDDESNIDERYDRNFLRHSVTPVLNSRWPNAERAVSNAIENLQADKAVLDDYVDSDLIELDLHDERVGQSISLSGFVSFGTLRQKAIIRRWCERQGYSSPEKKQLDELDSLLHAKADAKPCLRWGTVQLRRYNNKVYLLPVLSALSKEEYSWDGDSDLILNDNFVLRCTSENEQQMEGRFFSVRFEKAGIHCKPSTRRHSQSIKKLFQEYRVEPWLRPLVPLIYADNELVSVGDYWKCDTGQMFTGIQCEWRYIRA